MNNDHLCIIEAALFASSEPLTVERLLLLFPENDEVSSEHIQSHIEKLQQDCQQRGVDLVKVASGYRFQAKQEYAAWLQRLWERKPPRCSRALLETLALIVYRQPITRGEIEEVRGVAVSSNIINTLQDREWVKVVAHRDVPGKPALFGTTKQFLDYFNLKTLTELPSLREVADFDLVEEKLREQLLLEVGAKEAAHFMSATNEELDEIEQDLDDSAEESMEDVLTEEVLQVSPVELVES